MVAVFNLENRGAPLSQEEIASLTEYLATKLGESGHYQIIPTSEVRRRLVDQKLESYKKCYEQSCQIELGRELAAQFTVSASVARVGSQCLVTAALYDLRKAATERTATGRGECSADALLLAIEQAAVRLAARPGEQAPAPELPAHMTGQPTAQPAPWPPPAAQPTAAAAPPQVIVAPMERRTKSPWAAMGWGLLVPGGGLFYCEKYGWGAVYLSGTVGAFIAGAVAGLKSEDIMWFAVGVGSGMLIDLTAIVHGMVAAANWKDPAYEEWKKSATGQQQADGRSSFSPAWKQEPPRSCGMPVTVKLFSFDF